MTRSTPSSTTLSSADTTSPFTVDYQEEQNAAHNSGKAIHEDSTHKTQEKPSSLQHETPHALASRSEDEGVRAPPPSPIPTRQDTRARGVWAPPSSPAIPEETEAMSDGDDYDDDLSSWASEVQIYAIVCVHARVYA
jgi:hypothetical protein